MFNNTIPLYSSRPVHCAGHMVRAKVRSFYAEENRKTLELEEAVKFNFPASSGSPDW